MGSVATLVTCHWMALWEDKNRQIAVNDTAKEIGTPSEVAPGILDQTSLNTPPKLPVSLPTIKTEFPTACQGYSHCQS